MKELHKYLTIDNLWEMVWHKTEATGASKENLFLLEDFEVWNLIVYSRPLKET